MKRIFLTAVVIAMAAAIAACSAIQSVAHRDKNPYENPFYMKYLAPQTNPVDQQIARLVDALRANSNTPELHNDLGQLLLAKGFAKDAEREFERAVDADKHFYPAWYNLGLVRAGRSDYSDARRAFHRTIHYKPGHAPALFQLGLMAEKSGDSEEAIEYYAKAIRHNRSMLDVHVNPRVLDSKLIDMALIRLYATEHDQLSMQFHPSSSYMPPVMQPNASAPPAPSPQPTPDQIVPPAPPATDPSQQRPAAGAAPTPAAAIPAPAAASVTKAPPSQPQMGAPPVPEAPPTGRGRPSLPPMAPPQPPPPMTPPATQT